MKKNPIQQKQEEEEEESYNVVELKLVKTDREPPSDDPNWLKYLPQGTHFLFRRKSKAGPDDIGVNRAVVVFHYKTATLLFDNLNANAYYIVVTSDFSNIMKQIEVIGIETKAEEQVEDNAITPEQESDRSN